jgi:hypothetical protein
MRANSELTHGSISCFLVTRQRALVGNFAGKEESMATKQTNSRSTPPPSKKKTESKAPSRMDGANSAHSPSRDDIAQRAFALYQARGESGGDPLEDWLAAERELSR